MTELWYTGHTAGKHWYACACNAGLQHHLIQSQWTSLILGYVWSGTRLTKKSLRCSTDYEYSTVVLEIRCPKLATSAMNACIVSYIPQTLLHCSPLASGAWVPKRQGTCEGLHLHEIQHAVATRMGDLLWKSADAMLYILSVTYCSHCKS